MTTSGNVPRWKRYLSPNFVISKVREKGVIGCTRVVWQRIGASLEVAVGNVYYKATKQPNVLYAFYDLAVSPATFDIVTFLVLADLERKESGCELLHVVIVPGPDAGFRAGDSESYRKTGTRSYDTDYMTWRLRNILIPCCWLIPSCRHITVCGSRAEAQALQASLVKTVFPRGYTVSSPKEKYQWRHIAGALSRTSVLPTIQATPEALRFMSSWIQSKAGERKVITITLRECSYEKGRNSSLKDWGAFARRLDPALYCPVVVRDAESSFDSLPLELNGLLVLPEVVWNIELRTALYELSYLNMLVDNGPALLCKLNRCTRFLIFKLCTSSGSPTVEEYYRDLGIEPGIQLHPAIPFQRFVWENDRLDVIQEAFRDMCDGIDEFSKDDLQVVV